MRTNVEKSLTTDTPDSHGEGGCFLCSFKVYFRVYEDSLTTPYMYALRACMDSETGRCAHLPKM